MGFRILKSMLAITVILLFIQFWLGMNLNLCVSLPMKLPTDFFSYNGGSELLSHIIIGLTVFVFAGLILSYGSRLRNIPFLALSATGFAFALVAVSVGSTFAFGSHDDVLSLAMAMSFLLVFTVCLAGYFLLDKIKIAGYTFR